MSDLTSTYVSHHSMNLYRLNSCALVTPYGAKILVNIGSGYYRTWLLTEPNDYLNKCWLNSSRGLCHPPKNCNVVNVQEGNHYNAFENCTFNVKGTSPRGQWVGHEWYELKGLNINIDNDTRIISFTPIQWCIPMCGMVKVYKTFCAGYIAAISPNHIFSL